MRKITLLLLFILPFIGMSQTMYNVTFQVDMNNYTDTIFNVPEVNGTFNGWCGNCSAMSDNNSDGIWDITIPLPADSIDYKFSFDSWTKQEDLTVATGGCTKTKSGFTNRFLQVTKDTTLPAVCWESCFPCGSGPQVSNITFQVDMTDYTGPGYSMVNINGTFNAWCGNCAVMTDANNDMIYDITIPITGSDTIEYKFTLDGWDYQEDLMSGSPCTKTVIATPDTFVNRFYVPMGDTTMPAVCYNSCSECNAVGIDESWINNLSIQPNPTNGLITLKGEMQSRADLEITVYNIQGKLMHREMVDADLFIDHELNLSHLSDGLYMLTINNGERTVQDKLIVARQ